MPSRYRASTPSGSVPAVRLPEKIAMASTMASRGTYSKRRPHDLLPVAIHEPEVVARPAAPSAAAVLTTRSVNLGVVRRAAPQMPTMTTTSSLYTKYR